MNRPIYNIILMYNGVRYEYDVFAFDFDVTYEGCLTMYFKDYSRIVLDLDGLDDYPEISLIL